MELKQELRDAGFREMNNHFFLKNYPRFGAELSFEFENLDVILRFNIETKGGPLQSKSIFSIMEFMKLEDEVQRIFIRHKLVQLTNGLSEFVMDHVFKI